MENAYLYDTQLGKILIREDEAGITGLSLLGGIDDKTFFEQLKLNYQIVETELIKEAAKQLQEYLEGKRTRFEIPLNPKGTIFQKKVWEALRAIPYGETRSYKEIAAAVGNDKASRAVGMANHNNPIMCIIPCHRVIGANGALVGFGAGLDIKEKLLDLEKNTNRI
jgi:O-6-methylguanine DNA methyltransferase